ncbi:ZDHHC2_15_20 [Lepeophtheirus salmonis]|uniref:Palmitoyltransferase n=1 Tax=Lepeophtheirus salmonis TaxID=72036 RepID=A0A7R8HCX2_LEPSM|nr:ZDHHC2_15_20 [Lepeophtheirus salmonis]CAF3019301.1 ZDHHC2_15_20 [Lepeophtheirus salmonis]
MGCQEYCSRPCLLVAAGIRWTPVAFISGILIWSYYAYVFELNFVIVSNPWEKSVYLMFYHILLLLLVWSYLKTILSDAGKVPSSWRLTTPMNERLKAAKTEEDWKSLLELFRVEMELPPVLQRSVQGAIRYCEKCGIIKPDRSHHCSVCGSCIRKMDHHCPWVITVSHSITTNFFYYFWDMLLFSVFILLQRRSISVLFFLSVSSLFWYHIYLVLHNRTTLEQFRAPYFRNGTQDERGWSLGSKNNLREVFGSRPILWFLPIHTSMGDGLVYPSRISSGVCNSDCESQGSP